MEPADSEQPPTSTRQCTHEIRPGTSTQRATASPARAKPTLRYRKTPTCLLIIYLPTLIVPWVLICIMTKRPLGSSSYYEQTGKSYVNNAAGLLAAQVLKTINAVLAVPIISTMLAHAAIVYAMRRRHDQKLNIQQLFALADKGWSNMLLLWSANSRGKSSRFLWLAALLIALGAILQPLMSVLVTFEAIAATSCIDIPITGCSLFGPETVGSDPEPADMPRLQRDLVLQDVLGNIVTVSDVEPQSNLWPVNPNAGNWIDAYTTPWYRRMFFVYSSDFGKNPDGFFVAALENGTNTGVLREHAIRLNSSVHCERIQQSDFPSLCPGPRPLETHVERPGLNLSVCAPGNASQFPFTPSRHRQDVAEDLYINLEVSSNMTLYAYADNFTVHCTASTSRGYFELGNEQNHYVYGPLLDRWPDPNDIVENFNDFRGVDAHHVRPTEEDPSTSERDGLLAGERDIGSPFNDYDVKHRPSVPGPLMVSAEVLFGNYSLLRFVADNTTMMTPAQAYASVCEQGSIPFSQAIHIIIPDNGPVSYCYNAAGKVRDTLDASRDRYDYDLDDYLTYIVASQAGLFNNTDYAEYALMMSMYFANRAVLTKTASAEMPFDARPIFHSPGTIMARPNMATASLVVLTVLIFLQTLGLAIVAWLIYSVPSWASAFDALEVARIGKALADDDLPPLGPVTQRDEIRLTKIDALIGIDTGDNADDGVSAVEIGEMRDGSAEIPPTDGGSSNNIGRIQLLLGGKGLITRRIASKEAKLKS
ncbi:hypothetical protein F4779DRAFT_211979 [Xylariaceae sp. FL0662B]|nr:hypothetical protein F4779DRAFT_211979 [Xylariaceae sp. FL0662B]